MEGNSEEDYLDSLLDSVSVIKDDVVEDELYDEETNELIGALNDIMESVGDSALDGESLGTGADEAAAESIYGGDTMADSAIEELIGAGDPAVSELVLDDELKALLGDDSQSADVQMAAGEGLTPEQTNRLSQMDLEKALAQSEGMLGNLSDDEEEAFSLDSAIENGGLWGENAQAIEDISADLEVAAAEDLEKDEKGKGSFFSRLFKKKKKGGESGEKQEPKAKKEKKTKKQKKKQQPENEPESAADENEHVLNQLFDEQGELIENETKPVKKKSFFSNLMDTIKEEDEDEPEPPKEKKPKKSKKSKDNKGEDETEEGQKKGKKAKKAKKQKAPKPQKPKREKKPKEPPKPSEMMKVSKAGVIIMLAVIVGICGFAYVGTNTYHYKNSVDSAMEYLLAGNYEKAFSQIDGLKLRTEEDKMLYKQITVIMYVEKNYKSFLNLRKLGMEYDALDSLIHGVARYYEFRETGEELAVLGDMDAVKSKIVTALEQDYGISEALALTYSEIEDPIQYYYIISSYGGQN